MNAALVIAESIPGELEKKVAERTSELVKSTALLLKNEERLRLLISGVEDYAIFTKDLQGVVTSWNPGAERMYGYTAEEIVTDVVMPGMNGRVLAEKLLEMRPDLRVLFVSGYTDDVVLAPDPSPAILVKPFPRERLASRVRDVLDGHSRAPTI